MKRYPTLLALGLLSANVVIAQHAPEAEDVLRKTSDKLNNLKAISYTSYREINNFTDNYFSKNTGDSYFEYRPDKEGKVSRFQLRSGDVFQVYNGTEYFFLNEEDRTSEFKKTNAQQLGNLSLLYNSMTTLRIALPLILNDEQVPKSLKDTLIENKTYHLIKFELHKKALNFPNGFWSFESDVTRLYRLIVDKETYLPYMIFDGNNMDKEKYYTKTIFTKINTNPTEPTENTWFFSSYEGYRPKAEIVRKPLITIGSTLPEWALPEFKSQATDTLTSADFKGKITLLEFWIKNCGYCMSAFPEIKALQEKYGEKIAVLSINAYEEKEDIAFFYDREKPAYKMLYDGEGFAESLGIYGYPAAILIDQTGKVAYTSSGFNKEKVEEAIRGLL